MTVKKNLSSEYFKKEDSKNATSIKTTLHQNNHYLIKR
ncbi:hypothetical protein M917_2018 [Psychrobacter aquaticus CMS 56]|uniref:Uncharacterized protein n=1 Tax=Psychrobacter aquaticus CMS 56 TaxID=1354303 RepID=U4T1M4_9GAMM|nr:hypothetical protein M917_2018 [Psychrobacter aquaticus CMS 56]